MGASCSLLASPFGTRLSSHDCVWYTWENHSIKYWSSMTIVMGSAHPFELRGHQRQEAMRGCNKYGATLSLDEIKADPEYVEREAERLLCTPA